MFILAVDERSLHASNAMAAVTAAERFIDRLQPDDLVGLYAYPTGTAQHDFTTDHGAVRRALRNIMRETSAHNLIGVEAGDDERDGEPHASASSAGARRCAAAAKSSSGGRSDAARPGPWARRPITRGRGGGS